MADLSIDGLDDLLKELERLGHEGEKIEKTALLKAGEKVKDAILIEAPHKTGNLKNSIKISGIKNTDGSSYVEVYPSKDAYYAAFLEFGTTKMGADPFLSRGYENSKEEAENIIIDEVKKGLGL